MSEYFDPPGGDGNFAGGYIDAKLLARLEQFLQDPINFARAQHNMASAPAEDRDFLAEVLEDIRAGRAPDPLALEAVNAHAGIFCGSTFRADGIEINDTSFW